MKNRGAAGWLILILALTVPGLLFFNWWSRMDREKKRQLSVSVRKRTEATPFSGAANKNKLSNPVTPHSAAEAVVIATAAAAPPVIQSSSAAAPPVAVAQAPVLPDFPVRDPMLSPYDEVRIKRKELEKIMKIPSPPRRGPAAPEPEIEESVDLQVQGIVSTTDGLYKAIVNGEVVGEGESVAGALILKISGRSVVFRYHNKKITKFVSR